MKMKKQSKGRVGKYRKRPSGWGAGVNFNVLGGYLYAETSSAMKKAGARMGFWNPKESRQEG